MTRHRWVEPHNTRLGYKEYIKPSPSSQYLIPSTRPELQSIDFTSMKDSLVTTKSFPIWIFNSLFHFLCERTVILWIFWAREESEERKITVFFTGQIRRDIKKAERRLITTDISRRTALRSTSKQLSAPSQSLVVVRLIHFSRLDYNIP